MDGPQLVVESREIRAPPDISNALASDHQGLSPWTSLQRVSLLEASFVMKVCGSGVDERAPAPLELVEGFVLLCHTAYVTLLEEWATTPCARSSGWHRGSL